MFLKQSVVLVVVALLLVEANTSNYKVSSLSRRHSDNHDKHDIHEKHEVEETVKVKVHDKGKSSSDGDNNGGCRCGQYKELMKKVMILLKAYGSKELIPDLQAVAKKTVDYFLNYLAQEKPEQLNKFHGFLESTTKVTGNFVGATGGGHH